MSVKIIDIDGRDAVYAEESAIEAIAARAASESGDIVSADGSGLKRPAYGRDGGTAGARVSVEGGAICIRINVVVSYGARIPDLTWNLQNRVKKTTERYLGARVDRVDVCVVGVR